MFGKLSSQPLLISRSTLGLIGVLLNIYAIDHMVLSDADTLMKLNPFWTIVLSLIFLHEKVRKYQITAMIIAIIGMLLIVKPEFSSSVIPSIAGLLSGILQLLPTYVLEHSALVKTLYDSVLFFIILSCSSYTFFNIYLYTYDNNSNFSYSALDYQQL